MRSTYDGLISSLKQSPHHWLVTGASGFIGSHLVETLLRHGQRVTGIDNFATSSYSNLEEVQAIVGPDAWRNFRFIEGDIRSLESCHDACREVQYVLHQAALASVPRSINDPISSTQVNVDGFVNMLVAAKDAGVKRFVYASSSSVYGDEPSLPKHEDKRGALLSPYALTKLSNELYADVFARCYGMQLIGLRYFNVFGPRQDPEGPYAAVLPRWTKALLKGEPCVVYGDGETSRDFCFVDNAVQANLLAAVAPESAANTVYNVAVSDQTTLNQVYALLREAVARHVQRELPLQPRREAFRAGDIRHSLASIDRAVSLLGYAPAVRVGEGLHHWVRWVVERAPWAR